MTPSALLGSHNKVNESTHKLGASGVDGRLIVDRSSLSMLEGATSCHLLGSPELLALNNSLAAVQQSITQE